MTLGYDLYWSFRSPYSYLVTPRLIALEQDWDVVLSDFNLPGFSGLVALDLATGQAQHRAQAQFGLGAGKPALAGGKKHVRLHSGEGDSTRPRPDGPNLSGPA